jgi:hypothetical protein
MLTISMSRRAPYPYIILLMRLLNVNYAKTGSTAGI